MHQRHRTVVFFIGILGFLLLQQGAALAGPKPREKILVVQDFEAQELSQFVMPNKLKGERYALGKKRAGHAYRCTASGGESVCWLTLLNVPKDVTPYRMLRFRIRGKSASPHPFYVLLLNKPKSFGLSNRVSGLTDNWKTVDLLLPTMHREDGFDPKSVLRIQFVWFRPPAFSFEIDDIQFVKVKAGGWQYSETELFVDTFGKKRAKKVKHHQTKHFDIYTDSSAAKSKFPKALEETYDFVRARLGLPEFKDRLPIYIHQNSKLYFDFCVRYVGWSRRSAENSAGHGSGRYFSTYYQSPKSDVVTHELTHSIFHRSVGAWGGSWLQEGVAVYIEYLATNRSAAKIFAPTLRGGRHTPLREFITIDRLIDAHNLRGGSSKTHDRYLQAGALFEFLMHRRAPRKSDVAREEIAAVTLPKEVLELAKAREEGAELAKKVESVFKMSIEDLEKAWIKWGSHPPKPK